MSVPMKNEISYTSLHKWGICEIRDRNMYSDGEGGWGMIDVSPVCRPNQNKLSSLNCVLSKYYARAASSMFETFR